MCKASNASVEERIRCFQVSQRRPRPIASANGGHARADACRAKRAGRGPKGDSHTVEPEGMYVMKSHSPARACPKACLSLLNPHIEERPQTVPRRSSVESASGTWCTEAVPTESDVRRVARCQLRSDRVKICTGRAHGWLLAAEPLPGAPHKTVAFVPADSRPLLTPMAASTRASAHFCNSAMAD